MRIFGLMRAAVILGVTGALAAAIPAKAGEGPAGPLASLPGGRAPAAAASSPGGSAGCLAAPYGANFYAPSFGAAKTVALTFDDGPGATTPAVLSVLRAYGVTATFFNIGQNAAATPTLVRAEAADGYLIGNHTWNHPDMPLLSASAQAAEMDQASAEQRNLIGWAPCVFRPPYGSYNSAQLTLAQQRGMKVWLWSVDTEDWKAGRSASAYWVNRILGLAESEGGPQQHPVILMHNAAGGNPATVLALPAIIRYFRDRGYTFVNLAGDTGTGYQILASAGAVRGFGAPVYGQATGLSRAVSAVSIAAAPDTGGYWVLKSDGSVASFRAPWYGSLAGKLDRGVRAVSIAASRGGYLVLTSDGGVHAFGAPWHGSAAGMLGKARAVGLAVNAATGGYWILNSAGGVWGYRVPWYGSLAGKLGSGERVTAIAPSPQGGYLLLTSAGAVHGYHATVYGAPVGALGRGVSALALAIAPATGGYWVLLSNGRVANYHAPWRGSLTGKAGAIAIAGI
jgi:peptidoglycan/xylan/chitin deacetylase (PgdA/CDA1 family)